MREIICPQILERKEGTVTEQVSHVFEDVGGEKPDHSLTQTEKHSKRDYREEGGGESRAVHKGGNGVP